MLAIHGLTHTTEVIGRVTQLLYRADGLGKFVAIPVTPKEEVSLNRSRCVHDKVVEEGNRTLRGCKVLFILHACQ